MILERVLLQTIKFDLQVEHPYESIIRFAKSLKGKKIFFEGFCSVNILRKLRFVCKYVL